MIINCCDLDEREDIKADICIIGAGAAGIAIAQEFIGSSIRVVLLESGLHTEDHLANQLYEGDPGEFLSKMGHADYLTRSRVRQIGGTTNRWRGWCRPLDRIDFEARESIPESGWPISRDLLDPYYRRAQSLCCLDAFVYDDPNYWLRVLYGPASDVRALPAGRLKTVVFQEPPHETPATDRRRFGQVYAAALDQALNVRLYYNATVLQLETDRNGSTVLAAQVTTLDATGLRVVAKVFVLAAGGIENTRILLLSDQNQATDGGLGNRQGVLGRYFMVHPVIKRAADTELDPALWKFYTQPSAVSETGVIITGSLVPGEQTLYSEGLANFRVMLNWYAKAGIVVVNLNWEQVPNPESSIGLSDERDRFGQRKVRLDWKLVQQDKTTARHALDLLKQELAACGLGDVNVVTDLSEAPESWIPFAWMADGPYSPGLHPGDHHMGTTRMSQDPERGVVDEHCRVHHTKNLYVASCSVFPTGGYANPMLTIVALALRLADHLKPRI